MIVFWVVLALFGYMASFLLGNLLSWCRIVEPLQETEAKLREELRGLRGELWANGIEISNLRTWVMLGLPVSTPEGKTSLHLDALRLVIDPPYGLKIGENGQWERTGKISHRVHSDVLKIDSIDDLIEGTKP